MAVDIRIANIAYGDNPLKRATAVVTFHISAQEDGGRVAEDFTVVVGGYDQGDPTATVNEARKALRKLALDMVAATEE